MTETGLTGKRRSTTIAATPDDGKSQRKRGRRINCVTVNFNILVRMSFAVTKTYIMFLLYI